jgi:hypothetical protein
MNFPKKKPPGRAALLIYSVAVLLLAWWPWNVLLLLGIASGGRLNARDQLAGREVEPGAPQVGR